MPSPSYKETFESGALKKKAEAAWEQLEDCHLCPRQCGANRIEGEKGLCRTGSTALVSGVSPHFGEEAPLVGRYGSGTLFFTYCPLGCVFCQNYELSHLGEGRESSPEVLADRMLYLQDLGCHNINWVTPTHVVPMLLKALLIAIPKGLNLPLVYNCGGYESLETLRLLDRVVDIYLPDFKFWDPGIAEELAQAPDYPEAARQALREMHRQVGELLIDSEGVAGRGLLLRHLVMPNDKAGTRAVMEFLAREISLRTYVNIMDQYRPSGQASGHPSINRRIYPGEYAQALEWAGQAGLFRLDQPGNRRIMR
ncbi:MAG: radical SAM protein [Desulfobacca sp.]|nr:radical SAM protein [Desulfobacca sp.]